MGAGKTTVGRYLAAALKRKFYDSDREIERRTGASIPLIFDVEGEAGFRARERLVIDELTQMQDIVLATGGGVVLDPDNRKRLAERGRVIYLYASIDELLRRTARDRQRPLLQTPDRHARLEAIMVQRDPLYREMAELIIETGNGKVWRIVNQIIKWLSLHETPTR
jgi:shikimate kinase